MTNDKGAKQNMEKMSLDVCVFVFVKVCVCFLPLAPVIGWVHFVCYAGRLWSCQPWKFSFGPVGLSVNTYTHRGSYNSVYQCFSITKVWVSIWSLLKEQFRSKCFKKQNGFSHRLLSVMRWWKMQVPTKSTELIRTTLTATQWKCAQIRE